LDILSIKTSDIISNAIGSLIATILIMLSFWFKESITLKFLTTYHFLRAKLANNRYVLIWNDDDISHSKKICKNLKVFFPSLIFKSLRSPKELLLYPCRPSVVQAVIFIISDVTKLSESKKDREKIQKWLVSYVEKGGGLIGTHDIIYRRVRNTELEKVFGCQLNEFKRVEKVKYVRNPKIKDHEMFKDLPESFELEDREVVWGDWSPDVYVYFKPMKAIPSHS